jgi:hypothetical protein
MHPALHLVRDCLCLCLCIVPPVQIQHFLHVLDDAFEDLPPSEKPRCNSCHPSRITEGRH